MKTCRRAARLATLAGLWLAAAQRPAAGLDWPALEREGEALLSRYLQLDTTNPPGNERLAAEFWRDVFEQAGIESQLFEAAPGRANIYARLRGDGTKPAVVLMHHMDVVPADARFWQKPPFSGEIRDGAVWGRGALDVKGMGVANALVLLALAREGGPRAADVIFLGVADEEAGGARGAGFMLERHFALFEGAGVVLNEGGYIALGPGGEPAYYAVEIAQKTPCWLRLVARGMPGHGSVPRPGTAPDRLVAALAKLAAYETPLRVLPLVQRFHADTAHLEPELARRAQLRDLRAALRDPAFAREFTANPRTNAAVRNTFSLTVLQGSNQTNVIPAEATAELDARLLPDEDPAAFRAELARRIGDPAIQIETLLSFPPASSPADHELFAVLREIAARDHRGAVVTTPLALGFTDCHYFRTREIPCYGFMPFQLAESDYALVHGNDERLSLANLRSGTRLLHEIVTRLAGASR